MFMIERLKNFMFKISFVFEANQKRRKILDLFVYKA